MRVRTIALAAVAVHGFTTAWAETPTPAATTAAALPTFVLTAPPADPSPWTGLSIGSEVFGVAGGKGVRGGFGGGGFLGYDRELDNGLVIGLRGSAGYAPGFYSHSPITGFNYGEANVRVGYDMGRFMPFVTAGFGVAAPNFRSGGYGGVANAANDLFNTIGNLRGFETAGAGFAYQLTNRLSVEVAVQAYRGNGFSGP